MNRTESRSSWRQIAPGTVFAHFNAHAPFWISLLCIVLIAWYLARLTWLLVPAPEEPAWIPPPTSPSAPAATRPAGNDYRSIPQAHLFGEVSADDPVAEDAPVDAPDTSLNLQLRGVVSADEPDVAHAIIADAAGGENVYFPGDSVPGGATLARVEADRVLLNRNGQFEILRLPREGEPQEPLRLPRSNARSGQPGPEEPEDKPVAPVTADAVSRSTTIVKELLQDTPASFLKVIRPQPYLPGGQFKGFRIFPGASAAKFKAIGLKAGDLVTQINGVTLDNPAKGMAVFRTLNDQSRLSVAMIRYGSPLFMEIDMSEYDDKGRPVKK